MGEPEGLRLDATGFEQLAEAARLAGSRNTQTTSDTEDGPIEHTQTHHTDGIGFHTQAGEGGGENPPISAKDMARRASAAKLGKDHLTWDGSTKSWNKDEGERPDSVALQHEILLRDPERKPKAWGLPKMAKWLSDSSVRVTGSQGNTNRRNSEEGQRDAQQQSSRAPAPAPAPAPPAVPTPAGSSASTMRWVGVKDSIRLLHCITEDKEGFLKRDKKPDSRCDMLTHH